MDRKIVEWLGVMLLVDGIAFMVLLFGALLNASSPWVVGSMVSFILQHPDLWVLVILAGPSAVLILQVSRKVEEAFLSIITSMLGLQKQDRKNHKPRNGED